MGAQAREYSGHRSIPPSAVSKILSQSLGKDVPYSQIFAALKENFGDSATNETPGKRLMKLAGALAKLSFGGKSKPAGGKTGGKTGKKGLGSMLSGLLADKKPKKQVELSLFKT